MRTEMLPEANTRLQTALLRHAVAKALKSTNGNHAARERVRDQFKLFCKKLDDNQLKEYSLACDKERLRVFNLCESSRHEHMVTASNAIKPMRKEVQEFDEVIRTLVERRNAIDAEITKIVKENGEKWQAEEKRLNDEMNKNIEAITKKFKDQFDEALRREMPEYCG